jgi:hypothetical protein
MCKSTSARWNPRKNITYVDEDGMEKWYDFPRSPSDFHQRVTRALAESCQNIACSDFIFRNHKDYISNLHAIYNQGLHLLSTELERIKVKEVAMYAESISGIDFYKIWFGS